MKKLNEFIILVVGFVVLLFYITFKRQGSGKFYIKAQENKLLNNFLKSKVLNYLFMNFNILENNINKEFSDASSEYKNNPTLKGYGNFDVGLEEDINIEKQQRGLIVPKIKKLFQNNKIKNVVEIGTGNGDVIAYFAKENNDKLFTGIDFNTDTAKKKHVLNNLSFVSNYSLDHFLNLKDDNIDLVFASSTFIFFLPKEIKKYLQILAKKCKFIITSDPAWYGITKKKHIKNSYHLEMGAWFHNYYYYYENSNFEIIDYDSFHYKHKISPRPDIYIDIITAKNLKSF